MQYSQAEADLMRYGTDGGGSVHDVEPEPEVETCDQCDCEVCECEERNAE